MTIARDLAEFLVDTGYADLPSQAVDHAAITIASTLASAACGIGIPSTQIVRDMMQERGGRAEATVWFDAGPRLPAASAARINAVASDAAASDDSDLRNIVHCGTPLTATALAMAERTGANGKDILAAIVLGYEAAGRIGDSITPGYRRQGFHGCLVAIFAATVVAARLLRLDAAQTAHAIVLAATSMGGLHAAANTSISREYHAGLATTLGIDAAMAAARGFTGAESLLETDHGFCAVYGGTDGAGITLDLGKSWDIVTDMAIKLVPGAHSHHALAEAAANAARKGNVSPDEVAAIVLSRPGVKKLVGPLHPADLIAMAHSQAYFLAAGVADRDFTWAHAGPEKIADPVIHRLIDKIRVGPEPTTDVEKYRQGGTVTIETTDGRSFTDTVFVPKGSGCLGIDWADIDAKYRILMPHAELPESRIDKSLAVIHGFRDVADASALTDLLT